MPPKLSPKARRDGGESIRHRNQNMNFELDEIFEMEDDPSADAEMQDWQDIEHEVRLNYFMLK
jgi:hypothetical protein